MLWINHFPNLLEDLSTEIGFWHNHLHFFILDLSCPIWVKMYKYSFVVLPIIISYHPWIWSILHSWLSWLLSILITRSTHRIVLLLLLELLLWSLLLLILLLLLLLSHPHLFHFFSFFILWRNERRDPIQLIQIQII